MKPVFKKELDYLTINPLLEGYLWVNARCYYGFDKDFNKVKYGRSLEKLPVDTSTLLTHKEYCDYHYDTITKHKVELEKAKFEQYINENDYDEIIISVSGGKDSTVTADMCLEIAKRSNKTRVLFGNTSNETHHTYKYVKDTYGADLEIANPKEGFYNWCLRLGFIPTRHGRACCSIFKEGNITPYLSSQYDKRLLHVVGMRRDESALRSEYEQIRKGKWENKSAQQNWNMYLPIADFDDFDVWSYIIHKELPFNTLYELGYNRCGCTNCSFRTDYELKLNEHFLPTYDVKWKEILKKVFIEQGLAIAINCTLQEYLDGEWRRGTLRTEPTDEVIQDFADNKGIDFEQAKKYFKSNRCSCGKRLSKDMIGLNMKILGRNTGARMCLKCLAKFQETDVKSLKKQIEEFKADGCGLF